MSRLLFSTLLAVSTLHAADSALLFHKTIGGSGNDYVNAVATDPSGFVILGGATSSFDFPVTDRTANTATQFAATYDSGATWRPLGNLPQGAANSLVIAPGTPAAWYPSIVFTR